MEGGGDRASVREKERKVEVEGAKCRSGRGTRVKQNNGKRRHIDGATMCRAKAARIKKVAKHIQPLERDADSGCLENEGAAPGGLSHASKMTLPAELVAQSKAGAA